jgi:hypothetical protein
MESRFRELLSEAAQIAGEYRADFGTILKPPSPVTAFRYKAHAKTKSKKAGKPKSAGKVVRAEPQIEPAPQKPNPKIGRLQHGLATIKRLRTAGVGSGMCVMARVDPETPDQIKCAPRFHHSFPGHDLASLVRECVSVATAARRAEPIAANQKIINAAANNSNRCLAQNNRSKR